MFQKMENGAYKSDVEKGTEMNIVRTDQEQKRTSPSPVHDHSNALPSTSCRPEVCQAARALYPGPDLRGSPWSRNKTIFLCVTIGLLIVWIIIYATLSKLDIL